jgi:hypothetical protein
MQKYRLFEKTTTPSKAESRASMNGNSKQASGGDDPLDRLDARRQQLHSITDEEEDTGQFDVSKEGLSAKGIPKWAMAALPIALVIAALAWAIAKLR